jgi:endonuclease/exonuclease/phosphatase family metal-dependent hydrolase
MTLRVMTFNIRGYYHDDGVNSWPQREALNIATIRRCTPDLIGLQEAQGPNLSAYHRALREYHSYAWPYHYNHPPHEWPAIFWRPDALRPVASGGFWISDTPEVFSGSWDTDCIRSAGWIRFRSVSNGTEFVHLNTHLDHRSEWARVEGAKLIIARLDALQADDIAAVVTADFNCTPDSSTYRLFSDAGFVDAHLASGNSADPRESYTNHGWRGYPWARDNDVPQRIDWILTRNGPSVGASAASCSIIRDAEPPVYPSDHYPVLAEVHLPP